jgi:hypothetical protein
MQCLVTLAIMMGSGEHYIGGLPSRRACSWL